jgi:hypothetical protein
LKIKNRSRLGRALKNSGGKASRFSALSRLKLCTANRSHAAFAPKRPHGITPAANSFLSSARARGYNNQ